MYLPPKKLHYKPFTLNFIVYICIQKEISINPIHVGLYVGFGGINEKHTLIINNLSSKYNQKTSHSCYSFVSQLSDERITVVRRKFNSCQTINYLHKPT